MITLTREQQIKLRDNLLRAEPERLGSIIHHVVIYTTALKAEKKDATDQNKKTTLETVDQLACSIESFFQL